jgi:hypothetical protein
MSNIALPAEHRRPNHEAVPDRRNPGEAIAEKVAPAVHGGRRAEVLDLLRMGRARHDCNDGYGGSGSGLFDEAGHLIAMQSASLDMNCRLPSTSVCITALLF